MFLLNLDELEMLSRQVSGLICNATKPIHFLAYQFNERDHGDPHDRRPLKTRVTDYVAQHITTETVDTVLLLTQCRWLGYLFNPVSFYLCLNAQQEMVAAIAEVGNTFYEQKWYPLPVHEPNQIDTWVDKHYYVSPFLSVKDRFRFRLCWPINTRPVCVDTYPEGQDSPVLTSTMTVQQHPLTGFEILRLTARFPLASMMVMLKIHWQAFQLWVKRIPYYEKHVLSDYQTGRFREFRS
jgi:hypothetical protein